MTDVIKPGMEVQLDINATESEKSTLFDWYMFSDEVESQRFFKFP